MTRLPAPRGRLSDALIDALRLHPASTAPTDVEPESPADAALSLWLLYELSYGGLEGVADSAEWDPELLSVRRSLEIEFEERLWSRFTGAPVVNTSPHVYAEAFFSYVAQHDGVSLARYVRSQADVDQVHSLLRQRSVYHLKEADPTSFTLPRLPMPVKAALAELQYDEYGAGTADRLHSQLFADAMVACGLDPVAHLDEASVEVLEQNNAMSLFGLHRRLRGASLGHLAAFEATSSLPSRQMAQGFDRLGLPAELIGYYDEHVEADAVHEQLAVRMCAALAEAEPEVAEDIWFGAFTCLDLEDRFGRMMLGIWGEELAA